MSDLQFRQIVMLCSITHCRPVIQAPELVKKALTECLANILFMSIISSIKRLMTVVVINEGLTINSRCDTPKLQTVLMNSHYLWLLHSAKNGSLAPFSQVACHRLTSPISTSRVIM
ncbi:hypothetical protein CEXT_488271 [Caerostris extrusa]|uniref:Uncharacterized protein n=1 Tax=Caerostris extrusa TaxID=172846 RepID=A0AAV4XCS1_CAEEX|nr:hypothetical protein CEXT_488271 [Caerostris extrusa]